MVNNWLRKHASNHVVCWVYGYTEVWGLRDLIRSGMMSFFQGNLGVKGWYSDRDGVVMVR